MNRSHLLYRIAVAGQQNGTGEGRWHGRNGYSFLMSVVVCPITVTRAYCARPLAWAIGSFAPTAWLHKS